MTNDIQRPANAGCFYNLILLKSTQQVWKGKEGRARRLQTGKQLLWKNNMQIGTRIERKIYWPFFFIS